ncbi:MAG: 50S ribosomal protein L11 methyltransferase [Geobacter sp.]|jgi:ribosomal protein L11 methyltransferase|nr:50S ribosomal protein L11 methyltransferase [Geobacter sp.]
MAAAWYQVTCEVEADYLEPVADFLSTLSGCGVCTENRDVDSFSEDDIPPLGRVSITSYFTVPCQIDEQLARISAFLGGLGDDAAPAAPAVTLMGEEDWADAWKVNFKPLNIGKKLLVTPSWEQPEGKTDREVIILDPGMAFGTGGHETTRLCLECLESILSDLPEEQAIGTVLDLGTGSGILAIAAAKLGAQRVDAVDIDPQAVSVAAENCRLNQVAHQVRCSTTPLARLDGGYTLILANILAEELVRLGPELASRLAPGGSLILSGILAEREELVRNGYASLPLQFTASYSDGEWRCLQYRRGI